MFDLAGARVFVAGHKGMVGRALVRRLEQEPVELITADRLELDLARQSDVEMWMANKRPDVVIVAAAKVGGIVANRDAPVDFLTENLLIETNLIRSAFDVGAKKLLFLGSSCIYPKHASQPMSEECLLTGPLEPTNQWYALAKIAGVKLCEAYRLQHGADFISAMPTNLYGPFDNFDLTSSHVLPALIRKAHGAKIANDKTLVVWGTGEPRREFLHVDDLAEACVHLVRNYNDSQHINVGCGADVTIRELTELVAEIVGFDGEIVFDASKPDGTPRKLLDTSRLNQMGWYPRVSLRDGIAATYNWFLETHGKNDAVQTVA